MRKFGGLGTGKSPLRQRPQQPKNSMTSLASLAEMVEQANEDDYSNIKLCLNSERPQLEMEQSHNKNWRGQSPLRRGLNKQNDFNQFGNNRNIFETNRFADCLIKEKPQTNGKGPAPILGNLLSKNRQDVSPGKQRKLQQGDLVFRAGGSNISKGMNFSQISRQFNEQQNNGSNNELLSYAPSLQESRPKSRTKAPRLQKQFDEDDFVDVKQSIRQDEFTHKRMMNPGQKQRFETKIQEIKEQKMKLLKDKQHNKNLLPKIIEQIKANATRQIEEFAMYLFNQSKKSEDQYLLEPESKFPQREYEQRVQQKPKVIIGARHPIKPIETHFNKVNDSTEQWAENQAPFVQSEYPQQTYEVKPISYKTGSPNAIKLEPQPTKLVRGLQLHNSKDVVGVSVKQIGLQFSKKQDELVQELQRKRQEEEKVIKQRQQEQRERQRQENLMRQMQEKRRKFEQDARLRQQQANKLEQQRLLRQQQKLRIENEQALRRQEESRRQQQFERQQQEELQTKRREEQRLLREQEERERQAMLRKFQEQRLERERKQSEERQIERQKLEAERIELERIQRELRQADERAKSQTQRLERQKREQQQIERIRLETERIRLEAERIDNEKIERERVQRERFENEKRQSQKIQAERIENQRREKQIKQRIERQAELQRQRLEEERLRHEQQLKRIESQRLEREQNERKERLRKQSEQQEIRRKRVLEQFEAQRKRQEAQKLAYAQKERLQKQKQASIPVNTSFKFDLGGDDLKTSFKFDSMFTNFNLGDPSGETGPSPSAPSTLDDLTANAIKQSINITASNAMDFKFNF